MIVDAWMQHPTGAFLRDPMFASASSCRSRSASRSATPGKKVLFGSNFPMLSPAECLQEVDALGLSDETRALFLGENAARVFRLP